MISLKTYLTRDSKSDAAYRRIIGLFLQGIALHAVEGEKADHERFQEEIEQCMTTLSENTPLSELLVLVGGALRSMEDYNQRTSKFVRKQNTELHNMVSMLTETVISIGDSSTHSVNRLQEIEKSIERTQAVEDIRILKLRLGECLEAVRDEAMRQKGEGQRALEALQQELEASQHRMGSIKIKPDLDSATGLPGAVEADRAIRAAVEMPEHKFLLVAVCSRVQAINARFGYAVGDRVLAAFADHFVQALASNDQVFRWKGPALIALLQRAERPDAVRAEIRQFADAKLERTTQVGQRTILIPISATWTLLPVTQPVESLMKQVEIFTAAQIPRDYA
jgi:GGDEF domain-containing protein